MAFRARCQSVKDLTLSCVVFNQAQTRVALVTRLDPTPAVTPSNLPLFLVAAVEAENGTFKNYVCCEATLGFLMRLSLVYSTSEQSGAACCICCVILLPSKAACLR